jgi:hypothetical protein
MKLGRATGICESTDRFSETLQTCTLVRYTAALFDRHGRTDTVHEARNDTTCQVLAGCRFIAC